MGDRPGLDGGIDTHALQARGPYRTTVQADPDRLRQQLLHALWPDPLSVANQRARIARQAVCAESILSHKSAAIGVLHPDLQQPPLVADVEAMLEIAEPDHQPRRQGRSADDLVEPSERVVEARPIDQLGQPHELVPGIDDVVELARE